MSINKVFITLATVSLLATPTMALAGHEGINPHPGLNTRVGFEGTTRGRNLPEAIRQIVNGLLALVAIITAIFALIGGVRYITSQGDEDAVEAAKNTIIYAIIGLIVIALVAVIVNFVTQYIPDTV